MIHSNHSCSLRALYPAQSLPRPYPVPAPVHTNYCSIHCITMASLGTDTATKNGEGPSKKAKTDVLFTDIVSPHIAAGVTLAAAALFQDREVRTVYYCSTVYQTAHGSTA